MKWVLIIFAAIAGLIALMALVGAFTPRDHRATSTITLRQPPDSVWRAIREFGNIPTWWSDWRESVRLPDKDGHEAWRQRVGGFDMPILVLESQAPRRLVTQIDALPGASFGGTWTYALTTEGGGTRISITEAGWITNPIFRFLSRFVFGYYGSLDGYLRALAKHYGGTAAPKHS
jgi:uncharacterized protein YndB with AHSA1/START domain